MDLCNGFLFFIGSLLLSDVLGLCLIVCVSFSSIISAGSAEQTLHVPPAHLRIAPYGDRQINISDKIIV